MALSNTNFSLNFLDPDTYKQNLITYMQGQSQFQDYNYNGSSLSVLLDILSRNTFLNAFTVNMGYAEAHLDSAQLRDSVVSRSKELSYIPSSITSSTTSLNLQITTNSGNTFEIPVGTQFSTINSNNSFQFTTDSNYIQTSSNSTFNFSNVIIYEGTYTTDLFVVDTSVENQLFTLSNPSIDISSLSILVSENQGSQNNYFIQTTDLFGLSGNSLVYYLQATSNNQYQFYFGDGILGYQPLNGSSVSATYRVSVGPDADGCVNFNLNYDLGGYNGTTISNININTIANSFNGGLPETIDSIKFNAPKSWQTQDHAITAPDYKILILKKFPQVGDVYVYSGNVTPNGVFFGTVFAALISPSGNPLTQLNKETIVSYISNCNVFPIQVQAVDGNTIFIEVNSVIHVNTNTTTQSLDYFEKIVGNSITQFSTNNLQKFNTPFRLSILSSAINNTDVSIISNETDYNIKRYYDVNLNTPTAVLTSFNNEILNVNSSSFVINGLTSFVTSQYPNITIANGTLALIQISANNTITAKTIGTINLNTGTIYVPNLNINQFTDSEEGLSFLATPANSDIYVFNNDCFEIDISSSNLYAVSG